APGSSWGHRQACLDREPAIGAVAGSQAASMEGNALTHAHEALSPPGRGWSHGTTVDDAYRERLAGVGEREGDGRAARMLARVREGFVDHPVRGGCEPGRELSAATVDRDLDLHPGGPAFANERPDIRKRRQGMVTAVLRVLAEDAKETVHL